MPPTDIDEATSDDEKILLTFESRAAVQAVASKNLTCSSLFESGIIKVNSSSDPWISCVAADRHCLTVLDIPLRGRPIVGSEPITGPIHQPDE